MRTPNKYGLFPVDLAFGDIFHEDFGVFVLLLEAGAPPHAKHIIESKTYTLLHSEIHTRCLPIIRLLLWYDPDYESILDPEAKQTVQEHIRTAWRLEDFPAEEIIRIVEQTAIDAREVKALTRSAETAEKSQQFERAAQHYNKISQIYLKHKAIEEKIPYRRTGSSIESDRPYL